MASYNLADHFDAEEARLRREMMQISTDREYEKAKYRVDCNYFSGLRTELHYQAGRRVSQLQYNTSNTFQLYEQDVQRQQRAPTRNPVYPLDTYHQTTNRRYSNTAPSAGHYSMHQRNTYPQYHSTTSDFSWTEGRHSFSSEPQYNTRSNRHQPRERIDETRRRVIVPDEIEEPSDTDRRTSPKKSTVRKVKLLKAREDD